MAQHPNSAANRPQPHPIGYKQRVNARGKTYWRIKRGPGDWQYVHIDLAERLLGRKLHPNERVYFKENVPSSAYKDPQPDHIEVRIISPRNGRPPGNRRQLIRRIMEAEFKLEQMRKQLGDLNEFYGKKRDDMSDPSIPRDWKPGKK